jgi:hypothetical protein
VSFIEPNWPSWVPVSSVAVDRSGATATEVGDPLQGDEEVPAPVRQLRDGRPEVPAGVGRAEGARESARSLAARMPLRALLALLAERQRLLRRCLGELHVVGLDRDVVERERVACEHEREGDRSGDDGKAHGARYMTVRVACL